MREPVVTGPESLARVKHFFAENGGEKLETKATEDLSLHDARNDTQYDNHSEPEVHPASGYPDDENQACNSK